MQRTRGHPRYALEIDAELSFQGKTIPGRTRNISHGGLCVVTERPLPAGHDVMITIALIFDDQAMSEPLPLRGRIVWCTPVGDERYQVGATFVSLTHEDRQYVELFLRYLKEA